MSSRIYSVNQNSVITDQADVESNKRSLILSFVVGITLFSMGLPLLIIGSISTAEDRLAMLIPGAILFVVGAFVTIVAAVKRATSNINYYPKPRDIMSLHPLSGKTFVLQNQYPGYDHKFVSFRTEDLALRVIYEQHDAMPIQFVAVEGKPNTYHLLNKYKDGSKADRAYDQWISFANDGKWLYCRYPKKTDAMPVLIEHVEADTIIMNNQWPGQEAFWLSFANEGKWMRVTYQKKEAMPMKLISYSPIEILEAVPGKPVRFRINNRPSSNDAWVGIYPTGAGDQDHGEQNKRWKWLRDIDVNNASLPARPEGNWSIRVFSDGGFTLHHREDFEIERIPFDEQLKIKQEIQEKKEEMFEQIKEKMEEVEEKLPEEIKETESFQEMKSTVENTVESLDEKANQAIEEVIVESTEQMEQVQEKVLLSLEDSLSKLNDTLERLDKTVMSKDRENIISELSGSQMNLNMTIDRIDNTIGYGIDEALRGGKTIVGNIEGVPHPVSIKVPKSMNDFASGLEKGQTIEQKVTLSTFNSVRKMLEFVIDK